MAFTSRRGGTSEGPFASLNLGALTADDPASVAENRRRAVTAGRGDPACATMAWQVHGSDVREVTAEPAGGRFLEPGKEPFPRSDGLVTSLAGRPLMLLTADCIPVAIARADGGRLAVLHAGWRGLEAGICERGAEAVGGEVVGAVGPGRRAVLLRGRRRRGRAAAGALWRRRRPRPARRSVAVRAACARGGRCAGRRRCGRVHHLHAGPVLLAPARPRCDRPPGRGGGAAWLTPPSSRRTSPGSANWWARASRSWPRPNTWRPPTCPRSARPASRSSARTAPTHSPPSRSEFGDLFTWDFIGHVQSRKVRDLVGRVRLIHAVDSHSACEQLETPARAGRDHRLPAAGERRRRGHQGRRRAGRGGRVPGGGRTACRRALPRPHDHAARGRRSRARPAVVCGAARDCATGWPRGGPGGTSSRT